MEENPKGGFDERNYFDDNKALENNDFSIQIKFDEIPDPPLVDKDNDEFIFPYPSEDFTSAVSNK